MSQAVVPGNSLSFPIQEQETPDYIRRSNQRHVMTPIGLFSNEVLHENSGTVLTVDSGELEKDGFYDGGDVVRACTDAGIEGLYCSARVGNFSYNFGQLEEGDYLVDLHFAEIVFTEGPPGMRVFDVFIQEEKVVSGLDVYEKVGGNKPLVLPNLKASVKGKEGLSIRFEGLVGKPIVCGISVHGECNCSSEIEDETVTKLQKENCEGCQKIKREYEMAQRDLEKIKLMMENLKEVNEAKSRECHEALTSLHELKMELMRKSMHVGSLAFAVEGQVKEKSRCFQCLKVLCEKLEMLKLEKNELLENVKEYKKCLETGFLKLSTALTRSVDHCLKIDKEHENLKRKFLEEVKERKDLYNRLIELKGNIRVFCRCRPMNAQELEAGDAMVVEFETAKDGEIVVKGHVSSKKLFRFDSVFTPEENQELVFEKTAPLATSVLDGYNVCIFAYGQTGTGKTFTMEGTQDERGVNFRTLEELFRIIREREGLFRYELTVSVLEVYNEQIRDLLQPSGAAPKRLEIKQQAGAHHVPGLVEAPVSNLGEAWGVLQAGSKARVVGSTNANEHSSRSHCMHCVMVRGENLVSGEHTTSKLWLIDLAGSERLAKTDAQGERLKEAQSINKSLSALGDVISSLATKSQHIPFRNSKLTHLLQDSLSGDSKTLMFVQISPNEHDAGETLCSLNFASRVRGVELGPAKRQVDVSELSRYKFMVGKAKQDNKSKDEHIKCMEGTIQSLEMKNKSKDILNKNLQDRIKELESQLLVERKLARQHVDTKIAEDHLQQQQLQKIIDDPDEEQEQQSEQEQNSSPEIQRIRHRLSLKPLTEINTRLLNIETPTTTTKQNDAIFRELLSLKEKENKPEPAVPAVKRLSLCPSAKRVPLNRPQFRRNSLATIPAASILAPRRPSLIPNTSNMGGGGSNKKVSSILRRSLQKKVIIRPPLWQAGKKGGSGVTGGMEKPRMSIGCARRVLTNNGGGGGPSRAAAGRQLQLQQREMERGWNQRVGSRKL
ncbi:Kinesin-like protein [Rhynchospora pubera]|uniref:Kinesin-like protein n=1 Tax=Rhynchospora pubera TaxID=906938 RepID=A0AAV8EJC1_9POAL|nr:Kinesin-like protein [Rhynchospora pubera]